MTIRQMAAVRVAALFGSAVLMGLAVNVGIHYLGLATMGLIMALALLIYMIKFVYDIELAKLESKNALTKLKELE
jgi:hypothetical protein